MSRGDTAARQLRLLLIIDERREVEVGSVARELGYTVRTVYRDLEVLQKVGVPLYQEQVGRRARWRVVDGYRKRLTLSLTWSEMLALTAGRGLLSGLAGTLFHESALSALEKIRAALPPPLLARVDVTSMRVTGSVGASHIFEDDRRLLGTLLEAVEQQLTVEFDYLKLGAGKAERRRVDPYHVHVQSGGIYVIGWAHERASARIFLLDRIREVRKTAARFERRHDVDATSFLHGAFGPWDGKPLRVRLRFEPKLARLISERRYHESQTSQWRADGRLDVEMRVPLSPAFVSWVRGFDDAVTVLVPKGLLRRR